MEKQQQTHKTLEERAAEFDGRLDLDGEFDWGEPVGKEILIWRERLQSEYRTSEI